MPTVSEVVMETPIPVTAGFSWTAGGAWATFILLLGVIVRQVGPWRKLKDDAEQKLRNDLIKRVEKLEQTLDQERIHREIERSLDRHKINNLTQCLDAVLMILETAPDKTSEVVGRVRQMREAQMKAEAEEKAALHSFNLSILDDHTKSEGGK